MLYLYCQASIENHSLVEYRFLLINTVALKVKGCFKINLDSSLEESFYEMKRGAACKQETVYSTALVEKSTDSLE